MSWRNKKEECQLCEMEKRTKWYEETEEFVVAEKLGGGPFIVVKDHTEELDESRVEEAHELVESIFGEHEFRILMNIVTDHWHAHILTEKEEQDLSDE